MLGQEACLKCSEAAPLPAGLSWGPSADREAFRRGLLVREGCPGCSVDSSGGFCVLPAQPAVVGSPHTPSPGFSSPGVPLCSEGPSFVQPFF